MPILACSRTAGHSAYYWRSSSVNTMGEQFKLKSDGTCPSCDAVSQDEHKLQCFACKGHFHCVCTSCSKDDEVGTMSLVTAVNRRSTKKNFKFYCDVCMTNLEISMADSEARRLGVVEKNVTSIKNELSEIKKLLIKQNTSKPVAKPTSDNIWFNKERLATTKVPPAKPMLVVNSTQDSDSESIEKLIVDNGIPVTKSYKNTSGKLVLECDTDDSREKLKTAIASASGTVEMKSLSGKKPSITVVGFSQQYSKEEIINQIVSQNQFVKCFSTVNKINEHIEIHDVKPTRAKPSVFQAFASVSEALRKGFSNYRDKVTIGLTNCKIYDRYHVKRCNNCQGLGHFYKDCPNPEEVCCAKCSLKHPTQSCEATESKCINCVNSGCEDSNHAAFDHKCPSILKLVEKKKKAHESHLNSTKSTMDLDP